MHPQTDPDQWEDPPDEEPQPVLAPRRPTWATRARHWMRRHWKPVPVAGPQVDPELPRFCDIERAAEVLRHTLLSIEHWLSPRGRLREWIKFNLKAAIALAVPVVLLAPLIGFALRQFNLWTTLLATTTNNLIFFPLSALLMLGLICALVYFGRSLRRRPPHQRDGYYYQ